MPWDSVLKRMVEVPPGKSWGWDSAGRVLIEETDKHDVTVLAEPSPIVAEVAAKYGRGRPRVGKEVMTNAERQRRYRARKKSPT